ncbi:MAG: L,D-transpeptidase [Verrucomicrobiota bacterium]
MSITPTRRQLIVSIADQGMALVEDGRVVKTYPVSTSKRPASCLADSFGTPNGLHALADKIGDDAPKGTVFKGRVATGRLFSDFPEEERKKNLITSRIIRLRGLEDNKNSGPGCDSYDRFIYIHGTNHEDRIGEPFSGGCIEMINNDVIELFDCVDSGDHIWIT